MTREDQIIESDGRINIGGEWLELHPTTAVDCPGCTGDPLDHPSDLLWGQADWLLGPPDILDRIDDTLNSYDATSQPDDRPWPFRSF